MDASFATSMIDFSVHTHTSGREKLIPKVQGVRYFRTHLLTTRF